MLHFSTSAKAEMRSAASTPRHAGRPMSPVSFASFLGVDSYYTLSPVTDGWMPGASSNVSHRKPALKIPEETDEP